MATKTISIGEDAYDLLATQKHEYESFTDVIKRLAGQRSLLELAGILTNEEANIITRHIKETNEKIKKRVYKISEDMRQ